VSYQKQLACGFSIEPHRKRITSDDPASVRMHKLGTNETTYMTPAEARLLSAALHQAAIHAEETD
jgi:hypothetical protein